MWGDCQPASEGTGNNSRGTAGRALDRQLVRRYRRDGRQNLRIILADIVSLNGQVGIDGPRIGEVEDVVIDEGVHRQLNVVLRWGHVDNAVITEYAARCEIPCKRKYTDWPLFCIAPLIVPEASTVPSFVRRPLIVPVVVKLPEILLIAPFHIPLLSMVPPELFAVPFQTLLLAIFPLFDATLAM